MTDDVNGQTPIPETTDENVALPGASKVWVDSSPSLKQGNHWSSSIIWLSCLVFGGTLLWAFTAKLDQTISVRGRLQPSGSVREVNSPSGGVVSKVYVREAEIVRVGDKLFDVEAKGLSSRRQAIIDTLLILRLQSDSLQAIMRHADRPTRFVVLPPLPAVRDPALLSRLLVARQQSDQLSSRLAQISARLSSKNQTATLLQQITDDLKPLYRSGGMSRNQYLTQLNSLQEAKAEVLTLHEERTKVLAEAAAQLNDLNRQTINLQAELVGLRETISYRTVKAPIDDLKLSRSTVINASLPVLKIVPSNRLEAAVQIPDSDVGFVSIGMPASISVDSFPSGEFGYLYGKVVSLGSDALKPDALNQAYRFPATVSLDKQRVESGGKPLNLQSGMSVTANIKLRSRPVITIVSDMFTKQLEGVKRFR